MLRVSTERESFQSNHFGNKTHFHLILYLSLILTLSLQQNYILNPATSMEMDG